MLKLGDYCIMDSRLAQYIFEEPKLYMSQMRAFGIIIPYLTESRNLLYNLGNTPFRLWHIDIQFRTKLTFEELMEQSSYELEVAFDEKHYEFIKNAFVSLTTNLT